MKKAMLINAIKKYRRFISDYEIHGIKEIYFEEFSSEVVNNGSNNTK